MRNLHRLLEYVKRNKIPYGIATSSTASSLALKTQLQHKREALLEGAAAVVCGDQVKWCPDNALLIARLGSSILWHVHHMLFRLLMESQRRTFSSSVAKEWGLLHRRLLCLKMRSTV